MPVSPAKADPIDSQTYASRADNVKFDFNHEEVSSITEATNHVSAFISDVCVAAIYNYKPNDVTSEALELNKALLSHINILLENHKNDQKYAVTNTHGVSIKSTLEQAQKDVAAWRSLLLGKESIDSVIERSPSSLQSLKAHTQIFAANTQDVKLNEYVSGLVHAVSSFEIGSDKKQHEKSTFGQMDSSSMSGDAAKDGGDISPQDIKKTIEIMSDVSKRMEARPDLGEKAEQVKTLLSSVLPQTDLKGRV